MSQDCSPTVDCPLHETRLELSLLPTHLCGSELVTQQDIGDEMAMETTTGSAAHRYTHTASKYLMAPNFCSSLARQAFILVLKCFSQA